MKLNGKTKVLHVLTILNIAPAGSKRFRLLPDSRINAGARNNYYLIKEKEKENKKFYQTDRLQCWLIIWASYR